MYGPHRALRPFLSLLILLLLCAPLLALDQAKLDALRKQHMAVLEEIQRKNAEAAKTKTAGTPAHQQAMLELILRMQKISREMSELMNPRPADAPPTTDEAAFDFLSATVAIQKGELERGLNALEALVAGPLTEATLGPAMTLAEFHLDLVADPRRCHALCARIRAHLEARIERATDAALADRSYLQRIEKARCRAFALEGRLPACCAAADESENRERAFVADCLKTADAKGKLGPQALSMLATSFQTRALQQASCAEIADAMKRDAEALSRWEKARSLLAELEKLLVKHGDPSQTHTANLVNAALLQRARCLLALGRLDACLATFERWFARDADYVKRHTGGRRGAYYVYALDLHAEALLRAKRPKEALVAATRAQALFDEPGGVSGPYLALAWKPAYWLGRVHEATAETDEARAAYLTAVEKLEALYGQLRSGRLKGALLSIEEGRDAYRRLIHLLMESGRTDEAFRMLERSRSTMLKDMLKSLPLRDRSTWPPELLKREGELKQKLKKLQAPSPGPGLGTRHGETPAADPEALRKARWSYELFLRTLDQRKDREAVLPPSSSFSSSSPSPSPPSEHRALLTWFDDGRRTHAFTLHAGRLAVHPCAPSDAIAKALRRLRRRIASRSGAWQKGARKLHAALVAPALAALPDVTELVLVPTGELHALPFACLLDGKDRPLSTTHRLVRASVLAAPAEADLPLPAGSCLVLADPDGSLPNARREASLVADARGADRPTLTLEGAKASEALLKSRLSFSPTDAVPSALHLATHGLLERSHGLFSSLVLAPDPLEDGALTVAEIYAELDLRKTPLVVLSACNSAMGRQGGGDEVLGLSRAFQYAGAKWVLASLWEVDDAASAELMARFHRALAGPTPCPPPEALQRATTELRAASPTWANPYYWAAFTLFRP